MTKRASWGDYQYIPVKREYYEKNGSRWVKTGEEKKLFSENQYDNFTRVETLKFFRRLGGYERNDYGYTKQGYKVVKNVSISPGRTRKHVTYFGFDNADKLKNRALKNYQTRYKYKNC